MSEISAVSTSTYSQIASGIRLQTAADGAAELAIAKEEERNATGLDVGAANQEAGVNLSNIADGALGNIGDSLQRMRELALQASNGLLTDTDRQSIQFEIDEIKQGITDIASRTNYNTKNLLDGSNTNFRMATDSNGNSTTVTTQSALLSDMGLEDFDVTGDFDITKIDKALEQVNSSRSAIGAKTNALEYGINYNHRASQEATSARSRLEDLDVPKAVTEQKKKETLNIYQMMMQKRQREDEENNARRLFTS